MISILEKVFRKTMNRYWWNAMHSGQKFGVIRVQTIIHSEIKQLQKIKPSTKEVRARLAELDYILAETKKLVGNAN